MTFVAATATAPDASVPKVALVEERITPFGAWLLFSLPQKITALLVSFCCPPVDAVLFFPPTRKDPSPAVFLFPIPAMIELFSSVVLLSFSILSIFPHCPKTTEAIPSVVPQVFISHTLLTFPSFFWLRCTSLMCWIAVNLFVPIVIGVFDWARTQETANVSVNAPQSKRSLFVVRFFIIFTD